MKHILISLKYWEYSALKFIQNGVYEAKWAIGKKKYSALWSKNEQDLHLNAIGKIKIQDYLGKKMKSSSSKVKINNKVLYFEGDYNYILQ